LLAVIVILAIILAIAVPGISGIISSSRKAAFEADVKMIITAIEYKKTQKLIDSTITIPADGSSILATLANYGADSADYTTATLVNDDPVTITLVSKGTGKFGAVFTATNATRAAVTVTP
jgi:type II secretory pathway pseudopilin PulG